MRRRKSRRKAVVLRKQKKSYNKTLLVLTVLLTILGFVAVADASAPQAQVFFADSFYFVKQQVLWGFLGFLALFIASGIHYSFWKKLGPILFIASLLFLIIVLLPSIGIRALGARRWLALGPISFQPSEFVKLTLAIFLARLADSQCRLIYLLLPALLVAGLIMLQPDLGTVVVVLAIALAQLIISGISLLPFLAVTSCLGVLGFLLVFISDYRRQRLLTYLQRSLDPLGSSYHIRQILIALGSGGIFGVGLGQSRQKYLFLPEAATDSVFAVVAEEVGFIGSCALIMLLLFFIYQAIRVAKKSPDRFSTVLATGIVAWIGSQIFLNIASMVALIPLTGIPLPFFSYGGSSLTMVLLSIGILLNISKYEIRTK